MSRWRSSPEALERPLRYEAVPDDQARAEMAGNTPPPFIEAFFRFYSEGEFDDARIVGTVQALTGRAPAALSGVGARSRRRVRALLSLGRRRAG